MKTVKVHHSIFTIGFTSAAISSGAGMENTKVDELVGEWLAKGFDDVEVIPLKSNFNDSLQLESIVNEYVFRKYSEDAPAVKAKKADA